ncbi:hypothetical protein CCP4SC76_7870008 [Gammaproteobacteria bacterium]
MFMDLLGVTITRNSYRVSMMLWFVCLSGMIQSGPGNGAENHALVISRTGNGSITSIPAGIDCGNTCSANFADGATVTLTATPASSYAFDGWSGDDCSGTDPCDLTMDGDKTVSANFISTLHTLAISKTGNGTVTSTPSGIHCGNTCSSTFGDGATVTLTATPASGYAFDGWNGDDCSGTDPCDLTMGDDKTVSANFISSQHTLAISKTGKGTVTSTPSGIDCGSACSTTFGDGAVVTLTATSMNGYVFKGWNGDDCSGSDPCNLTMDDDTAVSAIFTLAIPGNAGSFPASTPKVGDWAGLTWATLPIQGVDRDLLVYRPGSQSRLPLLILFSPTGSSLDSNIADEFGRGNLTDFADREQVVLVLPMPGTLTRGDWDNHYPGTAYYETTRDDGTPDQQIGAPVSNNPNSNPDLALVLAIIQESQRAYDVDPARIYVNGFSNGAFFSYFVAAVLNDQIAAFAETGGGLVLSGTTAGDPTPCSVNPPQGTAGEVRDCAHSGWTTNLCVTPGAPPRPISPSTVTWVPPGFLEAHDDDTQVPFAHTCNLANQLPGIKSLRIVHQGGGHVAGTDYLANSWNFLKTYRLDDRGASDRVFRWAEAVYAHLFAPTGGDSQTGEGYYYRYYSTTQSYLGSRAGEVYYLLPGSTVGDAGPLSYWLGQAAHAGY